MKKFIPILLIASRCVLSGQQVTWQEVTSQFSLPGSIRVFHGTRVMPVLSAWYVDANLMDTAIAVRPYAPGTSMTVPAMTASVGAYVSVNGGFFGGSTPYSSVVYPTEVRAVNVQSVTRNATSYPVIRGFFGMKADRSLAVDWIYHFGNSLTDIYTFPQPLPYVSSDPTPQPVPLIANGAQYRGLLAGIGGGPVLIKDGAINVTYNQEIMWGSGVGETNGDPRTAVGYTATRHVIMMTVDGRQSSSAGVGLAELAQMLLDLGCVEALNLDGGGSTQMAIPGQYINSPSEQRAVPAILSLVAADSLNLPETPLFQKVIDTGDPSVSVVGGGWFESANPGYWGTTRSLLHGIGSGSTFVEFRPALPARAYYTVYGWWVSSSNRCTNTPIVLRHVNGTDTVRVDQTQSGSTWKFLGTYEFSGTVTDKVIVSDAGTAGTYVVADAIRFVSFDPAVLTSVSDPPTLARGFVLYQNFPNPFNPTTVISYHLPASGQAGLSAVSDVRLAVYDLLGRQVVVLVDEKYPAGRYEVKFDASGLASGVYLYRLTAESFTLSRAMLLLK